MGTSKSSNNQEPSFLQKDGSWRFSCIYNQTEAAAARSAIWHNYFSQLRGISKFCFWLTIMFAIILYFLLIFTSSLTLLDVLYRAFPWLVSDYANNVFSIVPFFAFAIFVHFLFVFLYRVLTGKSGSKRYGEFFYEFNNTLARMQGEGQTIEFLWEDIPEFAETPRHFVVQHRLGINIAVPKKIFQDADVAEQFAQFCKTAAEMSKNKA